MKPEDRYQRFVRWSDEDQCYIGYCPDLYFGGVCHGEDRETTHADFCTVVRDKIDHRLAKRENLPKPSVRAPLNPALWSYPLTVSGVFRPQPIRSSCFRVACIYLLLCIYLSDRVVGGELITIKNNAGKQITVDIQFVSDTKVAFKRPKDEAIYRFDRSGLSEKSNQLIDKWRSNPTPIKAGKKITLEEFNMDLWAKLGTKPDFYPWEGKKVVLFTLEDTHDPAGMGKYLHYLDQGWSIMEFVTSGYPKLSDQSKLFSGKGIIRCAPNAKHLQAGGLGMLGATDISLAYFYADFWDKPELGDFHIVKFTPDRIRGYCFYEMGRNFYLWGERHDLFTTGFAVAMRHICLQELGLKEPEEDADEMARQKREFHKVVSASPEPLSELFNSLGAEEDATFKDSRSIPLADKGLVNFYASMIIHGYETQGGLEWLRTFYGNVNVCPRVTSNEFNGAIAQWLNFVVCFNLASHSDMESLTRRRWKIPLNDQTWIALRNIPWKTPDLKANKIFQSLPFDLLPLATQIHDPRLHTMVDCPSNLVEESGFEAVEFSKWTKGQFEHKQEVEGAWDRMLFSVLEDAKYGKRSYKIEPSYPHRYQLSQNVKIEPKRKYLLSGWIKTKDLINMDDGRGASLGFDWFPSTESLTRTNDWTYLTRVVSDDKEEVSVTIRTIGVKGEAWFDDISLIPIPNKYLNTGVPRAND